MSGELLARWCDIDPAERRARLRGLQVAVRAYAGPQAPVLELLRQAEDNDAVLAAADVALLMLPTRVYRNVLASLAATLPPARAQVQ